MSLRKLDAYSKAGLLALVMAAGSIRIAFVVAAPDWHPHGMAYLVAMLPPLGRIVFSILCACGFGVLGLLLIRAGMNIDQIAVNLVGIRAKGVLGWHEIGWGDIDRISVRTTPRPQIVVSRKHQQRLDRLLLRSSVSVTLHPLTYSRVLQQINLRHSHLVHRLPAGPIMSASYVKGGLWRTMKGHAIATALGLALFAIWRVIVATTGMF